MIEIAVGYLPSDTSLGERAVRDMTESETDCSEVVLGRIASSPLEPFPPRDFRGKFKKMRHKKRPTILESRCHFDSTQLWRSPWDFFISYFLKCHLRKELFPFLRLYLHLMYKWWMWHKCFDIFVPNDMGRGKKLMGDIGAAWAPWGRVWGSQVFESDYHKDGWSRQACLTFLTFIRAW